ncbi:MAG: TetR/AcrR family transcriptional regulator [Deltaproteobacteria bacterium]|nr:TetR/AcrR family transcriptional regulator [Deltaproteobacteria bacterium]MBW1921893.1 TetR/AcrR family transcriptional regulator [Deltaproteobacteria bacterium]MBW1948056.1 TetR/AcrR family transcriptional regulator [Deltaproteobacteria bacterium]MBW2006909.1 TetR/AcrR family transcriptional regulator [Deltaproteobacteria bacterium]MBW2348635.1 TetR/AcrR family transcriptional regulator [Deltaproteobacteria bacterium]
MKAAETLFSTRGFLETKISDIATQVGVSDSTVYEHFKNKEDILFSIPREKTQQLIEINKQHLKGLVGAEVKLRKLIWNYIDFLVMNESYTSLLLFELRSNRDFYETENHELIRLFTREYSNIIVEGQKEGYFSTRFRPSIVLHMIFGTIDLILITWLVERRPKDPLELFDGLFDLFCHAIRVRETEAGTKGKKERILHAATQVFSRVGFQKARIQDIAGLAGVGDATIYQYFSNKEEILFALPVANTLELLSIQEEHLNGFKDTDLKLNVLLKDYLDFLDSHKEYSSICLFDLRYNKNFYNKEAYHLFRRFARVFYNVIEEGIRKGHFRQTLNPYLATKLIFGITDHIILSWIKFGRPKRLALVSNTVCGLVLKALQP